MATEIPEVGYYENYVESALKRFKRYETGLAVSLAIFVGIPLPGTGAFTGAVDRSTGSKKTSGMGFTGCWRTHCLHSGHAHNLVCHTN